MPEPKDSDEKVDPTEVPSAKMRWATLGRVGPAGVVILVCLALVWVIPGLEFARPWKPGEPRLFWNVLGRPFESDEAEKRAKEVEAFAKEALDEGDPEPIVRPDPVVVDLGNGDVFPRYEPKPGDDEKPQREIELFVGDELDRFFESLKYSDHAIAGSTTRVVHWGDSVIGVDGIPGSIRRRMQARFGDGGHGFHLMEPANTSYRHREVDFDHNDGWASCFIIQNCKDDGRYGLGGQTSWSAGGAKSTFAPHPKHSSDRVSRFEVAYLAWPKGGNFTVKVDGGDAVKVETRSETVEDRWYTVDVEDGHHEFEVRAAGGGRARLYGVTMEREAPGVVWNSLALVGAFTKRMNNFDGEHLKAQLEHADIDLAVFMFGGNDMSRKGLTREAHAEEYADMLRRVRAAKPDMDCLVMAPLDHGERQGVRIVSRAIVPEMVAAQREAAEAVGCAFFDTYQAMGGEGSAGRWYKHSPRLMGGDYSHATAKGHTVIGEMVYRALLRAYIDYRRRTDEPE